MNLWRWAYIDLCISIADYVGAAWIDKRFEQMLCERLEGSDHQLLAEKAQWIAWEAMRSDEYQHGKKNLHEMIPPWDTLLILIPSLAPDDTFKDLGIIKGAFHIHG